MLRKNLYDTVHMEAEQIEEIDLSGLDCPMPLLKAKLALNRLAPGALLKVHATDSGSRKDFETFSKQSGHELLRNTESNGTYTFIIRKKF